MVRRHLLRRLRCGSMKPQSCYRPGSTTVLPSMLTAVCASSLPLIDAPVRNVTDV
jgi:hypothetical protein